MSGIIEANRSLVLAADVEPEKFEPLIAQMKDVEGLGGVKIGFEVGLGLGLRTTVEIVRDADSSLKVIYDHQKAANDIPDTSVNFARTMERAGVDAAILFPFTGPATQEAWTKELQNKNIGVISGAKMTHPMLTAANRGREKGYVHAVAFQRMFAFAVELGVREFVVPGTESDSIAGYRTFFDARIGEGDYALWAPGFGAQGGDVSEATRIAGPNFHAIVGRDIYDAKDPRAAAQDFGRKVLGLAE